MPTLRSVATLGGLLALPSAWAARNQGHGGEHRVPLLALGLLSGSSVPPE